MFSNALPGLTDELKQVSQEMEVLLPKEWNRGEVGSIIQAVLAGRGKGYRPSLLLLMGRLGPDYPECKKRLYRLGALVELVHMASLIHDDIIDDSILRRGNPTIQARFGKDMAVYAGDLILGQVLTILLQDNLQQSGLLIAKTIKDMCQGEIGQAACRYRTDITDKEYYENIYGKTASMFVNVCKIGGIESGCDEETIQCLGDIGLHLGYLFQIRDDLLDFSANNVEDGKPARMDFQEGIFTLPVLHTFLDPVCRGGLEELVKLAKQGRLSPADFIELDRLILSAGGFDYAVSMAEQHRAVIGQKLSELSPSKTVDVIRYLVSLLELPKLRIGR